MLYNSSSRASNWNLTARLILAVRLDLGFLRLGLFGWLGFGVYSSASSAWFLMLMDETVVWTDLTCQASSLAATRACLRLRGGDVGIFFLPFPHRSLASSGIWHLSVPAVLLNFPSLSQCRTAFISPYVFVFSLLFLSESASHPRVPTQEKFYFHLFAFLLSSLSRQSFYALE